MPQVMNRDDGHGPYVYCKRGVSWCGDQTCDCVDSAQYRVLHQLARERRGWDVDPHSHLTILHLSCFAIVGSLAGLALIILWMTL